MSTAKQMTLNRSAILVLVSGSIALFYSMYFMQQLSYSIGIYSGISTTIKSYNLTNKTASNFLITALSQSGSLTLALHLTYALLPFAVLIFAMGVIWLFSRTAFRFTEHITAISSIIYLVLVALLEFDFRFSNSGYLFLLAYAGGILALLVSAYSIFAEEYYHTSTAKRPVPPIPINPDTPYSNIKLLSNRLMKKLSGELKILDMHFDVNSLENLMLLVSGNAERYTNIAVLTSPMRLGSEFERPYSNFKSELSNKNVAFELRVLDPAEAAKQHERILMDDSTAYKIPPINIINKKNEHIVGINHKEAEFRFRGLWSKATKFENLDKNRNAHQV